MKTLKYLLLALLVIVALDELIGVARAVLPIFWASATGFQSRGVTFSQMSASFPASQSGVPQTDGTSGYCTDCSVGANNVCVGSGTGSSFMRVNGTFICGLINAGIIGSVPDPMSLNHLIGIGVNATLGWFDINNQIDLCAHGFACSDSTKVAQVDTTSFANGSTTVTSGSALFKATDCNVSHGAGCTGTADKLILLYNGRVNVFSGTIVGFNSTASVEVSSAVDTSTCSACTTGNVVWGADDLAAWNSLMAFIGTTAVYHGAKIWCHAPILTSNTLLTPIRKSIDFGGPGDAAIFDNAHVNNVCMIIWAGPKDVPALNVDGNIGSHFHDFSIIGSTLNPPSALIRTNNSATNILNHFDRISDNNTSFASQPIAALGGNEVPTGDITAGATSITLTAPGAELNDLGPNQPIWILFDTVGGPEIRYTSSSYVRGANPIVLAASNAVKVAHLAVNNPVIDFARSYVAGSGVLIDSAGADQNSLSFSRLNFIGTGTCFDHRQQQALAMHIQNISCTNNPLGLAMTNGGSISLDDAVMAQTSTGVYQNGGSIEMRDLVFQPGTGMATFTSLLHLFGATTTATGGRFICDNCQWPQSSWQDAQGDMDIIGAGASTASVDYRGLQIGQSSGFPPGATQFAPTFRAFIGGTENISVKESSTITTGDPSMHVTYAEVGTGNNSTIRTVDMTNFTGGGQSNNTGSRTYQVLRGTDTFQEYRLDTRYGKMSELAVPQLAAPEAPSGIFCLGGGTGEDYYYFATGLINGHETVPSAISTVKECAGTLDNTTNFVIGTVRATAMVDQIRIYRAQVAHGAGAPVASASGLIATIQANGATKPPSGTTPSQVGFTDVGAAAGAAPPTTNETGQIVAGGPVTAGGYSVANLPACAAAGAGKMATVTNNVACAYGATPVATATAYVDCPVFCDGTQAKWLIH